MNALVLVLLLQAKIPASFPENLSSKHYELKTTATKEEGQELLDFMELVHSTYTTLLKPDNPQDLDKRRNTIVLFKDMEQFMRAGAPPGAGAYYDRRSKDLVGYYDTNDMKPFFAHEGMHQFTDATSKNFSNFNMWFTEGIADCIGNSEVRNKKLFMCVKSGRIARMRLPSIQAAIRARATPPLARLMTLSDGVFMRNADLCYAMSWSWCHFLITYPKDEDRGAQIPDGKFRKNLAGYYEQIRAGGVAHEKAWAESFKGFPLEEMEEQWKKYVLGLDAGKVLGIGGHELSDEELSKAGSAFEAGYTGILIEDTVVDYPAALAGIVKGDILLKFDSKRFPRHDALNRMRVWMQDVPYGRGVKVLVLRDGKEVECLVKWDAPKK
ncbi:MAG TPA: DUF1570 domain-containing protein [Planctomycetota bacterium]|nr:DUF1570 domain-containing protein [Planctomycetota bacterium]